MGKDEQQAYDEQALQKYQMISPLLDESLDLAKRLALRQQISAEQNVSTRTLYRYEKAYREQGFTGLRPQQRPPAKLSPNFASLIEECIQLKREVPLRSVNQIILILEMEGKVAPGVLKRSTVQKHLKRAGFGKAQMMKYVQASRSSSRRFWKPHRMMLVQSDIKYGPKLPIGKNGAMVQTYLVVVIDDHSRYVVGSGFFDSMDGQIVEDTYRRAILKYGKMDACYHDNGKQFVSSQLLLSLGKLGIRVTRCKPYSPASKGLVEVFNRFVNSFLAEARAQRIQTLESLNHYWEVWLETYYHQKPHEGIAECYRSLNASVPADGITPLQEWSRDSRPLRHLDTAVVTEAFLHHESRKVDNSGCISFRNLSYEALPSLAGQKVEISYDPMAPQTITIYAKDMEPMISHPLVMGQWCAPKPQVPETLLPKEPESSRFLEGLEAKRQKTMQLKADAISFDLFRKEAEGNV